MSRQRSVDRARRQRGRPTVGYFVTWDVNSRDTTQGARLKRFIYGTTTITDRKTYTYPGFVAQDGVQYLGQSVLFVTETQLRTILRFLRGAGVTYVVRQGSLGPVSAV